jgi:hypothetical protein
MYYWSRINFELSKYEYIIFRSMKGTIYFFLLCLITIMAFGLSNLVFDNTQENLQHGSEEYEHFIEERTGSQAADAVFSSYLQMLGTYEVLGHSAVPTYSRESQNWLLFMLIVSTVLSQMLFFNTLVSVIGSEYSKLWEKRTRWGFVSQTQLLSNHGMLGTCEIPEEPYVYIIVPIMEEET